MLRAVSALISPITKRILDRLPPFSPVLQRLLAEMAHDSTSVALLASLIETDPLLTGNLLQIANSANYNQRTRVISVQHAIMVLGERKLRNTALALSVAQFGANRKGPLGWDRSDYNRHSLATAVMADLIVQRVPAESAECAFTAGLLHDVGKLIIAMGMPREYSDIAQLLAFGETDVDVCELEVIGVRHRDLSRMAVERWSLPDELARAIGGEAERRKAGWDWSLRRVVYSADREATRLGFGMKMYGSDIPENDVLERMEVPEDCSAALLSEMRTFQGILGETDVA